MDSVRHFCREPVEWHIVIEDEHVSHLWSKINYVRSKPNKIQVHVYSSSVYWPDARGISNGYHRQMWIKMNAHKVIGNELCWNWDSDVIAQRPFDSMTLCAAANKPIMWISELNHLIIHGYPPGRRDSMMEIFGNECAYEFMRCMPIAMRGWILANGSGQDIWRRCYDRLLLQDPRFSEFNIIGEFCWRNFRDQFEFRNAELTGPTWAGGFKEDGKTFAQGWSWGGIPSDLREFVQNLS